MLWWEVFGTVWWSGGCMAQAARHLSGSERSVELAATRVTAVERLRIANPQYFPPDDRKP
jgi:hypothetical protein